MYRPLFKSIKGGKCANTTLNTGVQQELRPRTENVFRVAKENF